MRGAQVFERLETRAMLASAVTGVGTGLVGNYFSDTQLNNLVLTRTDPTINFNWGLGSPDPAVPGDQFSARWTGKVQAQYSETYTFYTLTDEGASLWVNGQQLVDDWSDHTLVEDSGSIDLKAGEVYDIRLEYYDNAFNATCTLSWGSASTAKQIIPTSQLYGDVGNISGSWLDRDLGNPGTIGAVNAASGTYNITGGGAGLESTSDQFQYLYQTLNGDGTLIAKVGSLNDTGGNARAGVMVRDSLDEASTFAGMFISPGGGAKFEYRNASGAGSSTTPATGSAPYWVKLVRDGTFFKGYTSPTGVDGTWVLAGTASVPMDRTVNVGLAVTSGSNGTSTKATFTNVSMTPTVQLGAGLDQVRDYSFGQIFVDAAKQARAPQTTNFGVNIATDADGWPAADFGQIFISGFVNQAHLLNGTYNLSFNGKATLGTWTTPGGRIQNQVYNAATNTTTADLIVSAAETQDNWYIALIFTATQRDSGSAVGSGVTNIKLIRPGYDPNNYPTFQQAYLDHLKQFSTLRFMDFAQTNNNTVAEWSDRITPGYARQATTKGAAWEYAIQIANMLHKDMWINIPVRASDDYITHLAQLVHDNLDPDRVVYLEYANEVWNASFTQYTDNMNAAAAEVAAGGSPLNADGETNTIYWGWRRTAKRLKEISDIFGATFGAGSVNTRVRAVLAGQFGQPDTIKQGLEFIDRTYGRPSQFFYAVAQAPYFGIGSLDSTRTDLSVDDIINAMSNSISGDTSLYYRFNSYATRFGLANMVYEGGPDTFGPNNIAAKQAASLDPRMTDLVIKYLNGWYGQGGSLFQWFEAGPTNWNTQFGTWGLSNALDNLNSPKILGTTTEVSTPKTPLTGGIPVPATIDARATAGSTTPYANPYQKSGTLGQTYDYVVRVPSAGTYKLTLTGATTGGNEQLRVNANSTARTITLLNTGGMTTWGDTNVGNITLAEGINFIRLTSVAQSAGWNMQTLTLAPAAATNGAPTVVNPATPSVGTVVGKTVGLSVLGTDDGGEAGLTYSWQAVGETATSVLFSVNGTNGAKNTTATFTRPGTYTFVVTISDGSSTATSQCNVTVAATLTSIVVTPTGTSIANGETRQLAALAKDQFGLPLFPQPASYTWSVDPGGNGGTVDANGLYSSPATGLGSATVRAAIGSVSGTATVVTGTPRDPDNPANLLPGLLYNYFEGTWTVLPNFDTFTPIKTGVLSNFSLSPKQRADNFGFSYNGYFFAPTTGTYTFYTSSDDGSKLFIGGNLIVNNDGRHGVQERNGSIILKTGWHALKVFYFDSTGAESLLVSVAGPGMSKQAIADANLNHVDLAPTVFSGPSASPNPITAATTNLSVLGADESGESALMYTWSATALPSGASAPNFSVNGTNGSKNTVATFSHAGQYTLNVAISDGTLTTNAQVDVTVSQTLTSLVVTPANPNVLQNRTQQFTASGIDQFGQPMIMLPPLTWAVTSGVGTIDSGGLYTASGTTGGETVSASAGGISGSANLTVIVDNAPTVANAAAANPNPVTGTTTNLTALGDDDGGEANLTYTWAATVVPGGAAVPTFDVNGTNAAKNAIATFSASGAYTFVVTISDGFQSITSSVNVTVAQTTMAVSVSPGSAIVPSGQTQQFAAAATDQFGATFTPASVGWSVDAGGTISSSGLFTAGNVQTGATISANASGVVGTATVSIQPSATPTIVTPAAASPSPVTGTTTNLSVTADDDGGEANLTYTWATTGTPPAAVSFSANGNHAARTSTATFTKAGTYNFQVTVSDGALSTTSACSVVVSQTLTSIVVSPAAIALSNGTGQQFSAVARDQFANSMSPQPGFAWSVNSTGTAGTITSGGLYTAPASGTPTDTVTATSGSVSGNATVTVTTASGASAFTGDADIGNPAFAGSYSYANGIYTVKGGGANIFDAADQFHFVYRAMSGDGSVVARVTSVQNTNLRAKAGVMMRETLAANSKQIDCFISPDHTASLQYRTSTGGGSSAAANASGSAAPYWVKLTRSTNVITAFRSPDGLNWTPLGNAVTVNMTSTIYVGLCLTASDNTKLNTSTFDNIAFPGPLSGAPMSFSASSPISSPPSIGGVGTSNKNNVKLAMDGNLNTFFESDVASGSWIGLDLGTAKHITDIRFAPRNGFAGRMVGGKFQVSNTPDFSSGVTTLYTVSASPANGKLSVKAVGIKGMFRYVRYLAPGNSFGNISEFSLMGY